MFIQDTPPDTSAYMIAGYSIFLILAILYLISLFIRTRNLNQDLAVLESMKESRLATDDTPTVVKPTAKRKPTGQKARRSKPVRKKVIKKK